MDYETNTARLVMLTLICVVVVISSDALAVSAKTKSDNDGTVLVVLEQQWKLQEGSEANDNSR